MEQTASLGADAAEQPVPGIRPQSLLWVGAALAVMIAAIIGPSTWFLNFVHVIFGVMWTGIDLFMGFVIGPIMRRLPLAVRRAIIIRLMPRMLFLMPTLSIVTGTAGWFLAGRLGYLDLAFPAFGWVLAALILVTILTLQGIFILLPLNLKVYLQMRQDTPDMQRVGRWMRLYVRFVALQGIGQILMIVIMARFVTGI